MVARISVDRPYAADGFVRVYEYVVSIVFNGGCGHNGLYYAWHKTCNSSLQFFFGKCACNDSDIAVCAATSNSKRLYFIHCDHGDKLKDLFLKCNIMGNF